MEVALTASGDHQPLSDEAQDLDDHARGLVSDLTDFNVRKRIPTRLGFLGLLLLMVAIAVLVLVITKPDIFTDQSEASGGSSTEAGAADQSSASSAADVAGEGPIGGTWDMYVTNSQGNENVAFTLRFLDDEYGTIEFPYDELAYSGTWDIDGDQISFGFARDFDASYDSVTEWSAFEGTLVGSDLILGEWFRDDWSCAPDEGCSIEPEPVGYSARLVRQS